jgi:hypothetical protein
MNYSQLELFPDEILLHEILLKLSLTELSRLCRSSRRFQRLCNNDELWRVKIGREYPGYPNYLNLSYYNFYRFLYESLAIPVYFMGDNYGNIRISNNNYIYSFAQVSIILNKILKPFFEEFKVTSIDRFKVVFTNSNFIPLVIVEYFSPIIGSGNIDLIDFSYNLNYSSLYKNISDIKYAYIVIGERIISRSNLFNLLDINTLSVGKYKFFIDQIVLPIYNKVPIYGIIMKSI